MKIEIDTDKLTWTEVPGKPTVSLISENS